MLGDRLTGRPVDVASNRVRACHRATSFLPDDVLPRAHGLIIGDDSDQPEAMTPASASRLSHLPPSPGRTSPLALAIAGPLLQRARPMLRLVATLAIRWFVVLPAPSRRCCARRTMAALAAAAFAVGAEREPPRLLAGVVLLLVVDPLLVRSIGFWLSVGATAPA